MLRFFKNIGREYGMESASRRFLKYALGEIVLVVIGILIALQIDSWNDDRLDRIQERAYLQSMLTDLGEDVREIEAAVSGNVILLGGLDDLLTLLSEPPESPGLQRDLFIHSVVYTYWYLEAAFSELTMTQLKYGGGLQLIRDRQVVEGMLRYEQALADCRHQYEEMINYFHVAEATQKRLLDMRLAKKSLEFIEEDPRARIIESLERFEPLVPEGRYLASSDPLLKIQYYGDVLFYRTALSNTVWFLKEQKKLAVALADLIEQRLGIES
jgi:hypothetical protein